MQNIVLTLRYALYILLQLLQLIFSLPARYVTSYANSARRNARTSSCKVFVIFGRILTKISITKFDFSKVKKCEIS